MKTGSHLLVVLALVSSMLIVAKEPKIEKLNTLLSAELGHPVPPEKAFYNISGLQVCCDPRIDSSEVGLDNFYKAYAESLVPIVNRKHSKVKSFRQPLRLAFLEYFAAECIIGGAGTYEIHDKARLPANLEWVIFKAEENEYSYITKTASKHDLSELRRICNEKVEAEPLISNRQELKKHFLRATNHLKVALSRMSPNARQYYIYQAIYFLNHAGQLDAST